MRILLASDHYPPFIGGAHRWADLLAHGLARRGHQVTVITEWHGGLPRVERSDDVAVHRVRQLRTATPGLIRDRRQRHSPPFPDPVTIWDVRRVVAAVSPEVALVHGWIASSVALALLGTRIPMLISAHDYGYFCATRTLLYRDQTCSGPAPRKCLECASEFYGGKRMGVATVAGVAFSRRILAHTAAGLQSNSRFVDEVTWKHVFGGSRRRHARRLVIPAFQDVDPPSDERTLAGHLAKLPAEPFILFVGALSRRKGVHILLEAYRRLTDPPPLVLIGTLDPETPTMLPPGATLITDLPHNAVMAAWDRAMLGVVPSLWPEPLGLVAIECASRGKPVIATMPSGTMDLLEDGAGILVGQGDVAGLAEAMQRLISDPGLREELGRAGQARAARFEGGVVVAEYERALADLIA